MDELPNQKSIGDAAHDIAKGILSVIPTVGGPLVVLFENIFTAPLNKRKQDWMENLAEVVTEIQNKQKELTPEKLSRNEVFITVALQSSQIAMRNHQKEKIFALKSALFNSVQPNAPIEDKQFIFLRLIDELTPWHLRLLGLLDEPEKWMSNHDIKNQGWGLGSVSTVIEHCFPELKGNRGFYDQLVHDLQTAGLLGRGDFLHITMTGTGMLAERTSAMGKEFIFYISRTEK